MPEFSLFSWKVGLGRLRLEELGQLVLLVELETMRMMPEGGAATALGIVDPYAQPPRPRASDG